MSITKVLMKSGFRQDQRVPDPDCEAERGAGPTRTSEARSSGISAPFCRTIRIWNKLILEEATFQLELEWRVGPSLKLGWKSNLFHDSVYFKHSSDNANS